MRAMNPLRLLRKEILANGSKPDLVDAIFSLSPKSISHWNQSLAGVMGSPPGGVDIVAQISEYILNYSWVSCSYLGVRTTDYEVADYFRSVAQWKRLRWRRIHTSPYRPIIPE